MSDDFWAPVFARLHENLDLLKLVCIDTSDADLQSWLRPPLKNRCARFIQKKKVLNRLGLIDEIIKFAQKESALRKLILFNWVEKNAQAMSLFQLPASEDTLARMLAGEFGDAGKIAILAIIEPRAGIKDFYQRYFVKQHLPELVLDTESEIDSEPVEEATIFTEAGSENDHKKQLERLRHELKDARKAFNSRANEIGGLQKSLFERDKLIKKLEIQIQSLKEELQRERISANTLDSDDSKSLPETNQIEIELRFKINRLSEELELKQNSIEILQRQLSRKESALVALNRSREELTAALSQDEDKERKIANLQRVVSHLEQSPAEGKLAGQLLCITEQNKRIWYLNSVGEDLIPLPAAMVRESGCSQGEFCQVWFGKDFQAVEIESLETGKMQKIGYLQQIDDQFLLNDGENSFAVHCEIGDKDLLRAYRGIFLPAFMNRPEGIYEAFALDDQTRASEPARSGSQKEKGNKRSHKTEIFDFRGKKLLIFGGDYVGNDYKNELEPHNLKITWQSGFSGTGDYRSGLAGFDLVVIILKQVSHTVLREINSASRKCETPVLYCKKRGISGLLSELKSFFKLEA